MIDVKLKKLEQNLPESFVDSVKSIQNSDAEKQIVELSKEFEDITEQMKADAKLNDLKEDVKALSAGYKDLKKQAKSKIQYLLLLLESRGKL